MNIDKIRNCMLSICDTLISVLNTYRDGLENGEFDEYIDAKIKEVIKELKENEVTE